MNKNLKEMLDFYKTAKTDPASALELSKKECLDYLKEWKNDLHKNKRRNK